MTCSQRTTVWHNSQCTDKTEVTDMQSQQYGDTMFLSGSICSTIYTNPKGGNFEKDIMGGFLGYMPNFIGFCR